MSNPPLGDVPWTHIAPASRWTIAAARAAVASHEDGNFCDSAQLADSMLADADIFGDVMTRIRALCSRSALPFAVTPSDEGDKRRTDMAAKRVEELWWEAIPESTLAVVDCDQIFMGEALGCLEWQRDSREWIPELCPLPLHGLSYRAHERQFHYIDADGTDHLVTPGDGRWFLHLPHGPRSWMFGAVRQLAVPFAGTGHADTGWLRLGEKHGLPILAIREPHSASDDVQGAAGTGATGFYAQFRRLGSDSVVRLPRGATKEDSEWDAFWLEAKGKGEIFEKLLAEFRRRKAMAILGRSPPDGKSLGGDGELGARTVKGEFLTSDAEPLATTIRDQIWKPFCRFNYGDEKLAPWGRWDTRPPPDLSARAMTLNTAADALEKLDTQGFDVENTAEEFGLKRRDDWKRPAPLAAPAAKDPNGTSEPAPRPGAPSPP